MIGSSHQPWRPAERDVHVYRTRDRARARLLTAMRRGGTMAEPCLLPAGGSGELAMARHGKSHQPTAAMLGLFGAAGRARRVCLAAPQATRTACHVFPVLALPPAAFPFIQFLFVLPTEGEDSVGLFCSALFMSTSSQPAVQPFSS